VVFVVTHFHSSDEVKENLNHPAIDEIVTTNTLPSILNRDMQGRLRKKLLVLKIEKWIAAFLQRHCTETGTALREPLYSIDISSKNPRWRPHEHLA
jgi:ribose-phosphate pyrophosphokinase